MEERSSNLEPGGSRPAGQSRETRREFEISGLAFGHLSRAARKFCGWRADSACGDREARPGLI